MGNCKIATYRLLVLASGSTWVEDTAGKDRLGEGMISDPGVQQRFLRQATLWLRIDRSNLHCRWLASLGLRQSLNLMLSVDIT